MAPTLYMSWPSPPVRAILMTSKAIGLALDLKEITRVDTVTPEYLKMNPQHTFPTLVDTDGFVIWDSHAIMPYLLTTYGTPSDRERLYPSDPKKRALVDQRLHFESGVVFARLLAIFCPLLYEGKPTIDQADTYAVYEIYDLLERFLEHGNTDWMAGDGPTIADYSLLPTVTSLGIVFKIDTVRCKRLGDWIRRCEELGENEPNKKGQQAMREMVLPFITGK